MDSNDAQKLLDDSRKKIDVYDEKIVELIIERTSLAGDIITAKQVLDMDLYDSKREEIIHQKVKDLLVDVDIDKDIVIEIFNLLATLSKNEQKKYLE